MSVTESDIFYQYFGGVPIRKTFTPSLQVTMFWGTRKIVSEFFGTSRHVRTQEKFCTRVFGTVKFSC